MVWREFQIRPDDANEWLVTFSGIPFGLMSEMLQGGGNRYLGMVYGTTARHSWGFSSGFSPAPVWKLWKDFGIEGSQMIGYWDDTCPVKTNHPDVKATVYIRPEKVLISIGNFDTQDRSIRLLIDWEKLGLDPSKVSLEAPKIENFQQKTVFTVNEPIPVKSKEGWLLLIHRQ